VAGQFERAELIAEGRKVEGWVKTKPHFVRASGMKRKARRGVT